MNKKVMIAPSAVRGIMACLHQRIEDHLKLDCAVDLYGELDGAISDHSIDCAAETMPAVADNLRTEAKGSARDPMYIELQAHVNTAWELEGRLEGCLGKLEGPIPPAETKGGEEPAGNHRDLSLQLAGTLGRCRVLLDRLESGL